jgi:hypothetical protein
MIFDNNHDSVNVYSSDCSSGDDNDSSSSGDESDDPSKGRGGGGDGNKKKKSVGYGSGGAKLASSQGERGRAGVIEMRASNMSAGVCNQSLALVGVASSA